MKKIIIPILATFAMLFSACGPDYVDIESINTRAATFTVTNDMWKVDDNNDLYASFEWTAIDDYTLKYGNVTAYLYEGERQVPLPYAYPVEFIDGAGNSIWQPLNIRFDIEQGVITFVVSDLGDQLSSPTSLLTMRFRAVVTIPVSYSIEQ